MTLRDACPVLPAVLVATASKVCVPSATCVTSQFTV